MFQRFLLCLFIVFQLGAKLPDLKPEDVKLKLSEIMKMHASHKEVNPDIVKRALNNFLEEIDPAKTYFIESDIETWQNPSDELLNKIIADYKNNRFPEFEKILTAAKKAVNRRHDLEKQIDFDNLPKNVKAKEFKDMKWAKTTDELLTRLERMRSLQIDSASKFNEEDKEKSWQRIQKRQSRAEEDMTNTDAQSREKFLLSKIIKSFASALDTHTSYFTPDEAQQFLINVQQRLFGIGAQLRDDLNGFTITKIIEGGPASLSKELKVKDKIIAVNGEPVVGMDITDAVELIRGEEYTPVVLTILREIPEDPTKENSPTREGKLDITILRGEVVLKETRFDSHFEPYGDGVIGHIHLHAFYQDPESSSSDDIMKAIKKLKTEHNLLGLVLDLRNNSGGLLTQAVQVAGLFITKGVVVSIKDDSGDIQHLRDIDGTTEWDGPLFILTNRASASASEIVAQTLQDYGRALVIGDDHTFGKGSFQTFTLNTTKNDPINPKGEYKVTRGRYYTVSGKSPQMDGVAADIVVPGTYSETDIGEKYAKYPLASDIIKENFDDDLSDIPFFQREKIKALYKFDLQPKLALYTPYIDTLKKNSTYRIANDKNYQTFIKELKKGDVDDEVVEEELDENLPDLQFIETQKIMKDLLYLMKK